MSVQLAMHHGDTPLALETEAVQPRSCIVNGPGEMADADFGYVGGAPGKIDLYVGKEVQPSAVCPYSSVEHCLITPALQLAVADWHCRLITCH